MEPGGVPGLATMSKPAILVTGGTRGIGRAVCDALAADHHLLIGGRDADAVAERIAQYPSAEGFVADLTDAAATALATAAIDSLDGLVHSAGSWSAGRIADVPRDQWRQVFELNVVAVADLTRMLLPALRAARGRVILLNSGAGLTARAGIGPYCASKFALRAFADSLREEERGLIGVTSIHPGRVDTDMQAAISAAAGLPYRRADHLRPTSVAATVRLALSMGPDANLDSLSLRPAAG